MLTDNGMDSHVNRMERIGISLFGIFLNFFRSEKWFAILFQENRNSNIHYEFGNSGIFVILQNFKNLTHFWFSEL